MPASVKTIGDHLRAARITKGLEQKQLADLLGVTKATICNWENGHSSPPIPQCSKLIEFIGYDPYPEPKTFAERLVAFRRLGGLRVKDAAALANVDPSSWTSWERGEHRVTRALADRIESLLQSKTRRPNSLMDADSVWGGTQHEGAIL